MVTIPDWGHRSQGASPAATRSHFSLFLNLNFPCTTHSPCDSALPQTPCSPHPPTPTPHSPLGAVGDTRLGLLPRTTAYYLPSARTQASLLSHGANGGFGRACVWFGPPCCLTRHAPLGRHAATTPGQQALGLQGKGAQESQEGGSEEEECV